MSVHVQNTRMTTTRLRKMKQEGEKIAMLTSYDFTLTRLLDEAGIEMILVGDSASNIVCGNKYTLPITVDEMIFLTKGVVRAADHALVVIDMPFGSYQVSEEQAVTNALKMMKESGADAVKLEGGEEILPAIRHMVQAGVPVMGHLGLTPQSVNQLGGYGLRGKGEAEAEKLLHDAKLLDEAGIDMILVGDSASNIVCGNRYPLPITVDEMIFLTKGVVRAAEHALVVIDMPFGSYQVSEEQAVSNALKMMKESRVQMR